MRRQSMFMTARAGYQFYGLNYDQGWGTSDNKKVLVQREFKNAETNQLGIALPKGQAAVLSPR